ncbi:hypothetical protein [Nocardia gipuzkoensis]
MATGTWTPIVGSRLAAAIHNTGSVELDTEDGDPLIVERESLLVLLDACATTANADISVACA